MKAIFFIARKEIRELMRDKRVRSAVFFGPMFMVFIFMFLFGFLADTIGETKGQKVYIVKADNAMVKQLLTSREVHMVDTEEAGKKLIREGKAPLLLEFAPDFDESTKAGKPTEVKAFFNPDQQISQIISAGMEKAFDAQNKTIRESMLKAKGIDPASVEPIVYKSIEVKEPGEKKANDFLVQLLPYLVVLWAFYGGMSSSSELVAGEKEKNTLETLLITPVRRADIAYGKFLALLFVCVAGSLSCVAGMAIAPFAPIPGVKKLFEGGMGVTPEAAGTIALIIIPCAALFASIMLAVSTNARNPREAQSHLTLVSFVVLMPAMFSQFIGFTDYANARWISFVPILGSANTIRHALQGKFDGIEIASTLAVNIVIAAIAIAIAIRLFQQEKVLVRI